MMNGLSSPSIKTTYRQQQQQNSKTVTTSAAAAAAAAATTTTVLNRTFTPPPSSSGPFAPTKNRSIWGDSYNYNCTINNNSNNEQQHAPSATAVSSYATTTGTSSSLKYYNDLLQKQMYGFTSSSTTTAGRQKKGKKKSKALDSIWTVQMPKKILYSTMSIFLVLPLFIFLWKETHIQGLHHLNEQQQSFNKGQFASSSSKNGMLMRNKAKTQEYVTWMANQLLVDEEDESEDEENFDSITTSNRTNVLQQNEYSNQTVEEQQHRPVLSLSNSEEQKDIARDHLEEHGVMDDSQEDENKEEDLT